MATKKELEKSSEGRPLSLFELESELTEAMENWLEADSQQGEQIEGTPEAEILHQIVVAYLQAATTKRDKVANFMLHLRTMEDAAKKQVEFYQRKQKTFANAYERIKLYVRAVMESQGVTRLEGQHRAFGLRKTPDRIEILDEKLIPERHMVDRDPVPDKRSIMDEYKLLDKTRAAKLEKNPTAEVPEPSVPGTLRHQDGKTVVIQ
jgi:Siphovirus Gp157